MSATTKVRKELTSSTIQELCETPELEELRVNYEEFGKGSSSKMSSYWRSYMKMACLLLCFIRSMREVDWNLHPSCIRDMLPWMFAHDRTNYSRYLSVYWCPSKMYTLLPMKHSKLATLWFNAQALHSVK